MVEFLKKKVKQYAESGNILDDPERLESLIHRVKERLMNSSDIDEIDRLTQLLNDLEQYLTF